MVHLSDITGDATIIIEESELGIVHNNPDDFLNGLYISWVSSSEPHDYSQIHLQYSPPNFPVFEEINEENDSYPHHKVIIFTTSTMKLTIVPYLQMANATLSSLPNNIFISKIPMTFNAYLQLKNLGRGTAELTIPQSHSSIEPASSPASPPSAQPNNYIPQITGANFIINNGAPPPQGGGKRKRHTRRRYRKKRY